MNISNSFINKTLFRGYKFIYAFLITITLNDYGVVNFYDKFQGFLYDAGDEAYEFIIANRFFAKNPDNNISIVVTRDKDLDKFPNYPEKTLVKAFQGALESRSDYKYKDEDGSEIVISYNDAKNEYCTSIHHDASASRYAIVTALENILKHNPKIVVLDYLFVGRSTHCPEYDEKLENIIKNNQNVFVMAGNRAVGSEENNLQNTDPRKYIHKTILKNNPESDIHDSMNYPFFKNIYKDNPSLNNVGSGNILVDSSVITEGRLWVNSQNYKIPTTPLLVSSLINDTINNKEIVRINWRNYNNNLYDAADIKTTVMNNNIDKYNNKIIIFGSNLSGKSQDRVYIPVNDTPVAGVFVQANIIDNSINNDFIQMNPDWLPIVLTVAIITLLFFAYDSQTILPHSCEYNGVYRKISTQLHNIFHFDIGEADFFLFIEGGAILISLLVLEMFDYYIDISGPVLGGIIAFSFFSIYSFFANKYLFNKGNLLREYINSNKYKKIYLLRVDFLNPPDINNNNIEIEIEKKVLATMSKNYGVIVGEFNPFDDDDIFGSISKSNYYWWVTSNSFDDVDLTIEDQIYKIFKKYKDNIALYWSIQDIEKKISRQDILEKLFNENEKIF